MPCAAHRDGRGLWVAWVLLLQPALHLADRGRGRHSQLEVSKRGTRGALHAELDVRHHCARHRYRRCKGGRIKQEGVQPSPERLTKMAVPRRSSCFNQAFSITRPDE